MMVAGLIITAVSGLFALVFLFAAVLAANPCGAFGDACDDHGNASSEFLVMLALTSIAIVAFVVGLVLVVKGFSGRKRLAPRD